MLLFWVFSPASSVNELLFGQRIARLSLECKSCELPYIARNYVPCKACDVVHDARLWTGRAAFGNWLGIVCPTCNTRIPCLWSIFSWVILILLVPLWFLPYWFYFRDRQPFPPKSAAHAAPNIKVNAIAAFRMGLFWGGFMYLVTTAVPAIVKFQKTGEVQTGQIIFAIVLWFAAGQLFGATMRWIMNRMASAKNAN